MNMFKSSNSNNIKDYIETIEEPRKSEIVKLDNFIKKTVPRLLPYFANNMLGYGEIHYKTKSGREGDWPVIALASQKNYISVYVMGADGKEYVAEKHAKDFPKASIGKSCIRFKKVDDIDLKKLAKVIKEGADMTLNNDNAFVVK